MECVNLKERFGKRFKVGHDEAYFAERGERAFADDPQLQIIPGRRGHVFPGPGDLLAAFCRRGPTANRLKALRGVEVWTDGSDGVTVLFAPEQIDQVADLLKLRRRRKPLTQEQLEERARRLAPFRFSARRKTQGNEAPLRPGLETDSEAVPVVPATSVDLF